MNSATLPTTHASSVVAAPKPLHVVIVDEELPYPPTSGKRIRTLNLTLRLARRHQLTYLCHRNADAAEARVAEAFFAEQGIETAVVNRAVPAKSGPGFYARLAANLLSPLPYYVASHTSPGLRAALPYTTFGEGLAHLAVLARSLHPSPRQPRRGRPRVS